MRLLGFLHLVLAVVYTVYYLATGFYAGIAVLLIWCVPVGLFCFWAGDFMSQHDADMAHLDSLKDPEERIKFLIEKTRV